MDTATAVLIAGAAVAGFVQGLSGFAFSMVAMAFWAWAVDPATAAVLAVLGALVGQALSALTVRRGFDWHVLWPYLAGAALGTPLGLALLRHVDATAFRAAVGALLALWCPAMLLSRALPRVRRRGRWADGAVGMAGGVLGGLGGFSGAAPTLWCTLRGMPKHAQRGIVQTVSMSALAFAALGHLVAGNIDRAVLEKLAIVVPAMLVPSLAGSRLYLGLGEAAFRRLVLLALAASGAAMLASSLPALLALLARA